MPTNFPSWGHDREGLESHFREKLQIPDFRGRVRTRTCPKTWDNAIEIRIRGPFIESPILKFLTLNILGEARHLEIIGGQSSCPLTSCGLLFYRT